MLECVYFCVPVLIAGDNCLSKALFIFGFMANNGSISSRSCQSEHSWLDSQCHFILHFYLLLWLQNDSRLRQTSHQPMKKTSARDVQSWFGLVWFLFLQSGEFQEPWLSNVTVRAVLGGRICKTNWEKTKLVQHVASRLKTSLVVCKKHCKYLSIILTFFTVVIHFPLQLAL